LFDDGSDILPHAGSLPESEICSSLVTLKCRFSRKKQILKFVSITNGAQQSGQLVWGWSRWKTQGQKSY
jgi:hypothetical protein